jgi:hypothetical protein
LKSIPDEVSPVLHETLFSFKDNSTILMIGKTKEEKEKDKKNTFIHIPISHYETDIVNEVYNLFYYL